MNHWDHNIIDVFVIWVHSTFLNEFECTKILTHSAREYFEKLVFKKTKKSKFKRSYLKSDGEFRVETNVFRKFIQISSKQRCFLHVLPTWVHGRGQSGALELARSKEIKRLKISLIKWFKINGHRIEPWGATAKTLSY